VLHLDRDHRVLRILVVRVPALHLAVLADLPSTSRLFHVLMALRPLPCRHRLRGEALVHREAVSLTTFRKGTTPATSRSSP